MHAETLKSIINGDKSITAVGKTHRRKRYTDEEDKAGDEDDSDEMAFEDRAGGKAYNEDTD